MKQRISIFALALFFSVNVIYAQTQPFLFKVLVSKGKAEVKSANSWQAIKIGTSLKGNDEIRLPENAYLGLIHINGRPLEVRDAKTYKVSDLVSKISAGSSALNKYTDFILSKEETKKDRLSATGAVTREVGGLMKDVILVYLPSGENSKVFGDSIFLQWSSEGIQAPYEIVVTNLSGDELSRVEVQEPEITLPIEGSNFRNEYELIVKVISKNTRGQGSKEYFIKKLKPADRTQVNASFTDIKSSVEEGTALSHYILAGFYEENMLLIDALTAYHQAAQLAPDVELYKTAYIDFLKRMGFKK